MRRAYIINVPAGGAGCLVRVGIKAQERGGPLVVVQVHEHGCLFRQFRSFQRRMATYVGRSYNLVGVSFGTQKEHGFRDASNPPWVEGEVSVGPVNLRSVILHRGDFAYQALVRAIDWVLLLLPSRIG